MGADWIDETKFLYTTQEEKDYKIKRYDLAVEKQEDIWTNSQLATTQLFYWNGQITTAISHSEDPHFTLRTIDLSDSGNELFKSDGPYFGYPRKINQQLIAFLNEENQLLIFNQITHQLTKLEFELTSTDGVVAPEDRTTIIVQTDSKLYQCDLVSPQECRIYSFDKKIEQMIGVYNQTLFFTSENYLYRLDLP